METKIVLEDGKYTVIHNNGLNFHALRYNEKWRDLQGDGLILALVNRIEELENIIANSQKWYNPVGLSKDVLLNTTLLEIDFTNDKNL